MLHAYMYYLIYVSAIQSTIECRIVLCVCAYNNKNNVAKFLYYNNLEFMSEEISKQTIYIKAARGMF